MDNSTNQELNRMTGRHRLFGAVISTFLGLSAFVLTAQDADQNSESTTLDQTTNSTDAESEQNEDPVEDQLTKQFLQEQTKEEFKEFMLNLDQYSVNDQSLIRMEFARRCSDASKDSSADICPDDIEPTWGNAERDSEQIDSSSDESEDQLQMPTLQEQPIGVLYGQTNEKTGNVKDPRRNNSKPAGRGNDKTWRNK